MPERAAAIVTVIALLGFAVIAVSWWGRLVCSPVGDVAFTVVLFSVVVSRVSARQHPSGCSRSGCCVRPDLAPASGSRSLWSPSPP